MKRICILIIAIGLFSFGCAKSPTTEKKVEVNSTKEIQTPETIQIPEEDERNKRLTSSPIYPQYWHKILGKVSYPDVSKKRNPAPEIVEECWRKITEMPPKEAWVILTQIENPDKPDLYPVDRVLAWAHEHVPNQYILELMHNHKDHLVYSNWLFGRWGYFYVKKYGGEKEQEYLKSLLPVYDKTPKKPYSDFIFLAYATFLKEPDAQDFLNEGFKKDIISLEQIFEVYGIDGVCKAAPLVPNPFLYSSLFEGVDQYFVYSRLLEVLIPFSGTNEDAVARWQTIITVIKQLERFSGKHISKQPKKLHEISSEVIKAPQFKRKDLVLDDNKLWCQAGGKSDMDDYVVVEIADVMKLRDQWLEAINSAKNDVDSLSPEEVNAQIESLRKYIIPPKGVSKEDVDVVFGVPEVINELTGKGSAYMYPMHIYQLFDPKPKQEFRAYLQVTYENDKAKFISINHYCVANGRVFYPQGSPLHIKQQREIERENRLVLEDLLEIKKNYGSELEDASWNDITSEQLLP